MGERVDAASGFNPVGCGARNPSHHDDARARICAIEIYLYIRRLYTLPEHELTGYGYLETSVHCALEIDVPMWGYILPEGLAHQEAVEVRAV